MTDPADRLVMVKQRDLTQMAYGPESPAGLSRLLFGLAGPESGRGEDRKR